MNTLQYFEIQASAPERLIAFYSAVFGWRFNRLPHHPIPYWRIETAGIHGGLLQRPADVPPQACGSNAFVCSMQVADFDVTAAAILAAGGQVAMPKFAVPGTCWQGYFVDVDGNTFGLFQVDAEAS